MAERMRADVALTARGLAKSREQARALIMAGLVFDGEKRIDKASTIVNEQDSLVVKEMPAYVSRGAYKLLKGIDVFKPEIAGCTAIDLGASTGGFTDVLLQKGAERVYAVDVGYGQLDWRLRSDPRVIVMERTNARYLKQEDFPIRPKLAVMDVSFISITRILPALFPILGAEGECITLIKPQFEAGREKVGKKGVVRDDTVHKDVLLSVKRTVSEVLGWSMTGLTFSPIKGPEGNIEFLAQLLPQERGCVSIDDDMVHRVVQDAHISLGGGHSR